MATEEQTTPDQPARRRSSRIVRCFFPLLMLVIVAAIVVVLLAKLRTEVWSYFTDDEGTRVEVQEDKTRYVLWQDPTENLFTEEEGAESLNQPTGRLEAAFSANGTMMVLVRWDGKRANADLYLSTWNGRVWTRPAAITTINTEAIERAPAFSNDGRFLYFASTRDGGRGGEDLYVARWNGTEWTGVEALDGAVNSPANESGPALAADDSKLYFSSNRSGEGTADIFVSERLIKKEEPAAPATEPEPPGKKKEAAPAVAVVELPPVPKFAPAEAVSHLNSSADDVQAALTARGDHVFLASDRDRNKQSGYAVYFSRVVEGTSLPPERVDLYIENGDVTDPAVRMDGFDLLFSASGKDAGDDYRLYRSTTREVIAYTDLTRWEQFKELMQNIMWWIILAILALVALLYLLEHWQDITNLFHKCLAGSAVVHLIILFLMMLWLIVQEIDKGGQPQSEVAISIDALAEEQLAMESEPEQAEIAESKNVVVTEKFKSDFMIPVFQPQDLPPTSAPIVTKSSKTSLVPDVRLSKANEAQSDQPVETPSKEIAVLTALSQTTLPEPEQPELQEETADLQNTEKPADPTADLFKPTDSVERVETSQAKEVKIAENAAQDATDAKDVEQSSATAETRDTGGDTVIAHRGLEAAGTPPALEGTGNLVTNMLNLPGSDSETDPLLPGELETPDHEMDADAITRLIQKSRGRPSIETIVQLGGSDSTEKAIREGLDWLVRNQEGDGRWDVRRHGAPGSYDTAGTGLALLCFYGWGARHDQGGPYQGNVKRAVEWLVKQQKENGDLRGGGRMYCHGIAAIALCEAYGATKDAKLKEPAERAIALILASQSPSKGGWRYEPANKNGPHQDADLSVTGWQYMALHSALLAGLEVPKSALQNGQRYLQEVASGKHGGLYGYVPGNVNPSMVSTGMFCRQLDLVPPTDPRMVESAEYLKLKKMNVKNPDFYYVYYATLALYQHQGPVWLAWNERLKETLPVIQRNQGNERGSWDPGSGHGSKGGRVVSTALSILSLEVYYRLLPMYGFRGNADLPAAKQKEQR